MRSRAGEMGPCNAKDYGGWAKVKVSGKIGTQLFKLLTFSVPFSKDGDKISDRWEKAKVADWNRQFGVQEPADHRFFAAADDKELSDSDGANVDGNTTRDMPANAAPGDSLSVFQEYRGMVLDGGGHDWAGANGHSGGHARLNPAYKELLIEADRMEGIDARLDDAGVNAVMARSAKAFSDSNDGALIRMYWVFDQKQAAPAEVFPNVDSVRLTEWARANRNASLAEFVQLKFADHIANEPGTLGISSTFGSYVFAEANKALSDLSGYDFETGVASVTVHELLHTLQSRGEAEHVLDGNENGMLREDADKQFLMYDEAQELNFISFLFDNVTRRSLDLTSKESVERSAL